MPRIAGIDLPREKRAEIGLTYIYGIGKSSAQEILEKAGINPDTKMKDLTEGELGKIREILDDYTIEGDLRREVSMNIRNLREINCYRGIRHKRGLPVRGQNTKNNARTRKGRHQEEIWQQRLKNLLLKEVEEELKRMSKEDKLISIQHSIIQW